MRPSITSARLVRLLKRSQKDDSFPGICRECGRTAKQPCEPDARDYPCHYCKAPAVSGAEELLFMMRP